MSETKRVQTWGEVHEVEAAIKALSDAAGAAARIGSIPAEQDTATKDALDSAISANKTAARLLRSMASEMRSRRDADDLERKKSGLW
jgi:hypothetical protein